MKMNLKKLLALALALVMVFALAACGGDPAPAESGSGEPAGTIKVAALESAYEETYPGMWQEVCDAFTAQTGIAVELTVERNLEDVIGASMQGGDYPDVIHLATGREAGLTEQFINDKLIADITDVLDMTVPGEETTVGDKIIEGFTDTSATNPYNDGKTYLAPMFYSPCGLFYNAGLFEEKGWEVPETWDEMWALGDVAAAEGIALFAYPTAGYFDAFFYALLYECGGPEFFTQATNYAEGIWDTEEAQLAFDIVAKLATYTEKSVPSNANNDNFTKNQQLILDNKALFMPNGTWVIDEMADAPRAEGFKWGFTALPAVSEGSDRYSYTWFEQLWIPSEAVNKDAAKQFVAFMYSDVAAEIFAKGGAIQPIVGFADTLEGDSKLFYSIYDNGAKAALGNFAATDPVEGVNFADTVFGAVNSLVSGDKTEEQWIEQIKIDSDLLRQALK